MELVFGIPHRQDTMCECGGNLFKFSAGQVWGPPGKSVGPPPFLVYINDLQPSVQHSRLYLFADDTKCNHPVRSHQDCQLLQDDLPPKRMESYVWNLYSRIRNVLKSV